MTPMDFAKVAQRIERMWGPNQKDWRDGDLWREFQQFTVGCVFDALQALENEASQYAPKPVKLKKLAREFQRERIERGIDPPVEVVCDPHKWGVLHYPGGLCVDGCDELTEHWICSVCHLEDLIRREAA